MEQGVGSTMTKMRQLEEQVAAWPHVSVHPHRFGGREFRFGNAELGHAHIGGAVDIPFPRSVRDALLAEGLAEEHRWVPNSGWTTFRIRSEEDLSHALWLMRLSYLRYALKTANDPRGMLEQESEELSLSPQFKSLLERFGRRITLAQSHSQQHSRFSMRSEWKFAGLPARVQRPPLKFHLSKDECARAKFEGNGGK